MGNCPPASGFGALVWVALCEVVECARALASMCALDSVLFESWLCVCESVGVDSVNALDCESALVSPSSILLRFCPCPFFRISLDSVIVLESMRLDSPRVLDCESALNVVLSTFALVDSVIVLESSLDSALASESIWLDSVNVLDSAPPRFCVFSFFRISLDSVSCVSFRISALDSVVVFKSVPDSVCVLDSESALDSVDSKFLRLAFSRIFSNFLESCVLCEKGEGLECAGMAKWQPKRAKSLPIWAGG